MRRNFLKMMLASAVAQLVGLRSEDAEAGCAITLKARNGSKRYVRFYQAKAKVKGGTWAKIRSLQGDTLDGGEDVSRVFRASLGCGAKRRYKFIVTSGDRQASFYYPSASSWTTATTINLGDVYRHLE
jgi:hypothetical protein